MIKRKIYNMKAAVDHVNLKKPEFSEAFSTHTFISNVRPTKSEISSNIVKPPLNIIKVTRATQQKAIEVIINLPIPLLNSLVFSNFIYISFIFFSISLNFDDKLSLIPSLKFCICSFSNVTF